MMTAFQSLSGTDLFRRRQAYHVAAQ